MPDFERHIDSLEIDLAVTLEEKAYVAGFHAGKNLARWQVVKLCAGFALGVLIYKVVQVAL